MDSATSSTNSSNNTQPTQGFSGKAKILGTIGALAAVALIGEVALNRDEAVSPVAATSTVPGAAPLVTNEEDDSLLAPVVSSTPAVAVEATSTNAIVATSSAPIPSAPAPTIKKTVYKDGTYTAQGGYTTHKGPEEITITITLKNDVITDSEFKGVPSLPMSQRFMDMFSQNYKAEVVGKNVSEVNLQKVSGSSLTPIGFNEALAKIKVQAKS